MDDHDGGPTGRLGAQEPWSGSLAVGPWQDPRTAPGEGLTADGTGDRTAVYQEVWEGEAFREVRRSYRRFAFPASAAFFLWYLAYVVAATTAPALMARPVAGPVNVAMAAGLAQFVTTFGLTWGYARHARLRRDRAALDVRWETQERTR